ncbi:Shwachman-Bodian-diamond syndrome protein [Trametes polyzona]|nr:Shwachman-Bodian-diamond syndrome protein [Trametes polyzona]
MQINRPSNQIKCAHNVSVARLKKGGKRFEIACYKNKVHEWRSGVETDIEDVLRIGNVFVNVSKDELAKSQDLQKAFGTMDTNTIVKEIFKKGELQVGDKEREHDLSSVRRGIATLVAEKCAGFRVRPGKNAKSQVSECIKVLQTNSKLPIQRARMRVRVSLPAADVEKLTSKILEGADSVEKDEQGPDDWEAILLIDRSQIRKECKGRGRLETLTFAATAAS